ncbi:MAG: metal ABC transporter ATP-binding protein [Oscillospiraceae bacterium]|nr:metal ABC transporter ATP-binding protein [Oscillospiraceae bacterium]
MIQITCKDAVLGYEDGIVAEGLNFIVEEGDYLCILGENGSGKSTLVKALLGLKSQKSGEITRHTKGIGYLPQQTIVQRDFPASVREIVRSGCLSGSGLRPFYTKEEKQRADETMQQLGIDHLAKRCYRDLSGGQQQRVLLARALCATKHLLLLDEPVMGLDPKAQLDLYEMIARLNKEGVTIIMVSHDVNAAVRYASHILHIGSRKQLFFGTADEYRNSRVGQSFLAAGGLDDEQS